MEQCVAVRAPAKLNLALAVGPRSETGYHPICSWMVTVDLHDELEVRRLPPGTLSRYAIVWHDDARRRSEIDWSITHDLAVRAHLLLEETVGRHLPLQLTLRKRIPVGAGLGGGSSDAAAMLRAVDELYALGLGTAKLRHLAERLGADVPFLIDGGSAVVEGFGEAMAPRDAPDLYIVLVLPEWSCATAEVYRHFDDLPPRDFDEDSVRAAAAARSVSELVDHELRNDLLPAAVGLTPQLDALLGDLAVIAERPARMTGSGSGLFVLADDPLHAEALAAAIEERLGVPALAIRTGG
jgi:4-diphosphocytidyl-2-C-methyl-D-erythritol kinase